jgi:hypothetical protein
VRVIRVRRFALLAAAVAVTGLALTGCTTPAAPATAGPSHAATKTPTPTPTQPAIPESSLPLGCADLENAAFVAAHYKTEAIGTAVDENSTARGFLLRAFQQGGGLHCVWGGSGRTDGGYDTGMELFALTDAAADYATYTSNVRSDIPWVADRLGTHSKSYCYAYQGFAQCYGDVLVGSTWLDFVLTDGSHAMTDDQAYAWGDDQLAPAIKAIAGAGAPRSQWVPPASAFDASGLCDAATATAIAGGPVSVKVNTPDSGEYAPEAGIKRAPTSRCTWTSSVTDANVDISTLTGGGWVIPGIRANPAEAPGVLGGSAQPVTIAGADAAFVSDGESAWGAIVSGGSLVEIVRESSYTGSDNLPLMTRIAAYIDAHS